MEMYGNTDRAHFGQYMWIDRDEGVLDGKLSHIIIGISLQNHEDNTHHINFYKLLQLDDNSYKLYDFKTDAISTNLLPNSASFKSGSFIWTS